MKKRERIRRRGIVSDIIKFSISVLHAEAKNLCECDEQER